MSVYKITQKLSDLTMTGAAVTSSPIALKSGYLRICPEQDAYVEIGFSPTISTSTSFWIKGGTEAILKENAVSQNVVGITTGATTQIILPEGTFSQFAVGDYVALTGIVTTGVNTTFASIATIDETMGINGGYSRKLTLNWNTSGIAATSITNSTGEIRKVIKIAASAASGKIHITEIQIAGG